MLYRKRFYITTKNRIQLIADLHLRRRSFPESLMTKSHVYDLGIPTRNQKDTNSSLGTFLDINYWFGGWLFLNFRLLKNCKNTLARNFLLNLCDTWVSIILVLNGKDTAWNTKYSICKFHAPKILICAAVHIVTKTRIAASNFKIFDGPC